MEDLATDRIYRLMIAQRMKHTETVKIVDAEGREAKHTPEFITEIFDEELANILKNLPIEVLEIEKDKYAEARRLSEEMIIKKQHDPI